LEEGKVIHDVDISWNEAWTGTVQVRAFELNGDILTLSMRIPDPVMGSETIYAVVWERVARVR
jgi:hypothetical protein